MKIPQYEAHDIAPLTRKYHIARLVCLCSLCLLSALFTWVNLTEANGSWVRWSIQTLPLALFIPGCFRGHYRTYSWLCFVVLFYFMGFVVNAMSPTASVLDYLGVLVTVVVFCAAMMGSRWRQHSLLAARQNPNAAPL
ncbi:DUF2069 domain-containing protein [Gilvimarinus agarilyticus]|uniref:DUF2069 domain-containing protein n=1 Tax=unclassified Gilvimarinus TaxID=2642066 RepID=UPI001C08C4A6|nr:MULTISPECIES: DUF2069 domain-containing protein [unclassified Gilvimarinus]MBU2887393.1 DUF2069 domain-containing protein [Gilvimarinus agarilyticus]MDO6572052.1 DUF2069 domain-containing protein [Gilvimarinus sp. 2_MG-2023]MDO6746112.1 DUF2069 domain-containing protein [Gilvimarinus sp. 1_MG-2023]